MKESYGSSPTGPIFKGQEGTVSQHTWEHWRLESKGGLSFSQWLWRTQVCYTFSEISESIFHPGPQNSSFEKWRLAPPGWWSFVQTPL